MPSNKEYLNFIFDQLSNWEDISYRAMMEEFILYYRGKIVGGIYDDRFLIKPTPLAISLVPNASYELCYAPKKLDKKLN